MEKLFFILYIILSLPASVLFKKYTSNTKAGIIIRFCWFVMGIVIFFLFQSKNFNVAQNVTVGFFAGGATVYFFNKFKALTQQIHH